MQARLCPKCGAYWECDCVLDDLSFEPTPGCPHDWAEAIGVEVLDFEPADSQVLICRLCGIYSVTALKNKAP